MTERIFAVLCVNAVDLTRCYTRRPASADRTARRQFQATGQPASRTQASDAMTSRLLRYQAKCVQRRCFQWGRSFAYIYQGNGATPANILIPLERQLIALQHCRWQFLWSPYVIGQTIIFSCCGLFFLLSFFLSFFSSPNLSGRRLDVYHTLAHGVALVRI